MAKNRKGMSVFDLPQDEVQQAAHQVQQESMTLTPTKKQELAPEPPKNDKLKIIYVDAPHHAKAKATAALRGLKLGEYIEHLIQQDKS